MRLLAALAAAAAAFAAGAYAQQPTPVTDPPPVRVLTEKMNCLVTVEAGTQRVKLIRCR